MTQNERKDYDASFCGQLPLHHLNHVQDYGFLLVCSPALEIVQVSENCEEFIARDKQTLVGEQLPALLTPESARQLDEKIGAKNQQKLSLTVTFTEGQQFLAICHIKPEHILLELEPVSETKKIALSDSYLRINEASAAIQQAADMQSALTIAAGELKAFSGFDKVMIYKFDEEWNGHVLAEEMEPDMESYLGITFPASDIPKQARELYLKNPYRQIPDREYVPAKMYPVIHPDGGFVDMSDCNLRGIVTVHLEYLANMKVNSSMSTRIIKDGALWGLIACHHKEKKFLSFDECAVFEFLSAIVSSKLSSLEAQAHLGEVNRAQAVYTKVVEDIYAESTLRNAVKKCANGMMELLGSNSLVYCSEAKITSYGECPPEAFLHELMIWLESKNLRDIYMTSSLLNDFEDLAGDPGTAGGMLALPVLPSQGVFIVLFRREILKSVAWGGNPDEVVIFEEDMQTYHPRHSFEVWKEVVKHHSAPFTKYEVEVARDLLRILTDVSVRQGN
jgi:two-component system, chemotaxis family, sensor kinase Cph1